MPDPILRAQPGYVLPDGATPPSYVTEVEIPGLGVCCRCGDKWVAEASGRQHLAPFSELRGVSILAVNDTGDAAVTVVLWPDADTPIRVRLADGTTLDDADIVGLLRTAAAQHAREHGMNARDCLERFLTRYPQPDTEAVDRG